MSRFKPVPKSRWSSQFFSVFLPASCIVDLAIIREFNGDIDGLILLLGAKYVFTAFILLGIRLVSVAIRRVINMLATSGASGCGKSTLLKIILGLLEPTDGRLLVGGKPITQDMVRTHRARIGAVLSEDRLLSGSINANVSLFDPQPDLEQIQTCCRVAEIHDDIVATPMGYHSVVGDMGAALSAGQQQRLLLARALYRRPALLLLDESTSHIDTVTAIKIFANLRNSQLTCVFVTHNESLLPLADDVFYLDGEASDCGISAGEFPAHTPGEGESLPPRATHPDD